MKKRSNMKKLFPVIAMLLVSAITLSTSTYAWFTMSRIVKAEGMELKVVAPTSLLISPTNETGSFAASATANEKFTGDFKLVPATSTNGLYFFSTAKIDDADDGAATDETNFFHVLNRPLLRTALAADDYEYKDVTNTYAGPIEDGYYADFTFWIKASGDKAVNVKISDLTTLIEDITNETTDREIMEAVRIAILDASTPGTPAVFGTSLYANTLNVATANDDDRFLGDAIGPIAYIADATQADFTGVATDINKDEVLFTCDAIGTAVPIIIRVWIEGQDNACITDNSGSDFKLTVGFRDELVDDADIK